VDAFLEYAHDNGASDIHIEPHDKDVYIRYRIDGILHEVTTYPKNLHDKIVFRIKIMSRLRTDEHAAAQDGRFSFSAKQEARMASEVFDVRVSVLPVTGGENVVLRLLSGRLRRLTLGELGLGKQDLEKVKRSMTKPYGMILASGPTGCGKTSTLYSMMQILNRPEVNIMTIEDPVEYELEGIRQTPVNPRKELTFAKGLRSIVRQDPDIIMVGEIRDHETANIAVNSAMTGHLVLSTIHTNDAATTFPRLIDVGVEPFLIASSANLVIGQRLVRKICQRCRVSYLVKKDILDTLQNTEPILYEYIQKIGGKGGVSKVRFYKGEGCRICNQSGYSGRTGIYEVMEITEELRSLITQKASASIINNKALELGMTTMLYDGIVKVFDGVTTLEEIVRATKS